MNVVFLDTVGLLALWDEDDQWHAAAEAAFAGVGSRRTRLMTMYEQPGPPMTAAKRTTPE